MNIYVICALLSVHVVFIMGFEKNVKPITQEIVAVHALQEFQRDQKPIVLATPIRFKKPQDGLKPPFNSPILVRKKPVSDMAKRKTQKNDLCDSEGSDTDEFLKNQSSEISEDERDSLSSISPLSSSADGSLSSFTSISSISDCHADDELSE